MPLPVLDRIRFRLDEHVDPAIAAALKRAGVDVTTTIDAELRAADDEMQLRFANSQGRVIVTRNTDSATELTGKS